MTHAERIREAERAVVERVLSERKAQRAAEWPAPDQPLADKADALLALRAATCPECRGTGLGSLSFDPKQGGYELSCPAGCDNGRRRTP